MNCRSYYIGFLFFLFLLGNAYGQEFTKPSVPEKTEKFYRYLLSENEKVISCHEVLENYISKIYKSVKKDTDKAKADMLASKLLKES